jgi:hypothetical protein
MSKQFSIQLDVIFFQGHAECRYLIETRNRVEMGYNARTVYTCRTHVEWDMQNAKEDKSQLGRDTSPESFPIRLLEV